MTSSTNLPLLKRQSLDEILKYPEKIISVYSVESHIWADNVDGSVSLKYRLLMNF